MISYQNQLTHKINVLVVFGYGNMFHPTAGNESRLYHLVKGLSKNSEIVTLERRQFKNFVVRSPDIKKRYFFNDVIIKNIHFGLFFSDLNPYYILKIIKIMEVILYLEYSIYWKIISR